MPYGAIIGGALGLMGAATQAGTSYASAMQQQEATRDAYQHRYQWTMEDMRKAGLNPLLAAQHGAGNVGSMSQMDTSGISSGAQVASQVAVQSSQADLNTHSAREAKANADIAEATAEAFKNNKSLGPIKAGTEAGLNPSSAIGAAGQAGVHSPTIVNAVGNSSAWKGYEQSYLYKKLNELGEKLPGYYKKAQDKSYKFGGHLYDYYKYGGDPDYLDKYHDGGTITKTRRRK